MRTLIIKIFSRRKAISFVLSFLLILLAGCGAKNSRTDESHPIAVRVVKPVFGDMQKRLSYIGTVHSEQEIQVIAQVQGTVVSLPFIEGAKVKRGDLVVQIDAPELKAALARLQAERDYWINHYEADQRLFNKRAITAEKVAISKRAYESAGAAYAEAESRLQKTIEKSPITGKVLHWLVEPGQNVMPGQPLLLVGNNLLEVHVDVVEEDVRDQIKTGTHAEIIDVDGNRFHTQVSTVAPMASGASRTFTVELPLATERNKDHRNGSSMKVDFILESAQNVMRVPVTAIANRETDPHIFLIRQDMALKQNVSPGIEQNGWIQVSIPWQGKDWVAVSNLRSLTDSSSVFIVLVKEVQP